MVTFVNEELLDKSNIHIKTSIPVYITMTTIPSRFKNTIRIIENFLKHVKGFEKIILNIPYSYNRWPDFKVDTSITGKINDNRFLLNRCEDSGPITKILAALPIIPDKSITIICDDMCYKSSAFKDIAEIQDKYRNKSFTFFVYPYKNDHGYNNVMVPQGADLISSYTSNLRELSDWFITFKSQLNIPKYFENECFFVDDQVIGWYFQTHGIPMEQVDRKHRMIYIKNCDIADRSHNLNKQTGKNSRENTMDKCYNHLNNYYPI